MWATGAAAFEALSAAPSVTTVTSWAGKSILPDLNAGRWVMKGEATLWNYIKTGFWGPQIDIAGGQITVSLPVVPIANSVTGEVETSSLMWPRGWEWIKGFLGQRVISP